MHIIFTTKYREPMIDSAIESDLYAYLGGICNQLECQAIKVGGYTDHIHLLCLLSRKISLMKLVEELKSHSSKWIKMKGANYQNFYWQDGYGAFSVSSSKLEMVINYIAKQHEHHKEILFNDEYRLFLERYQQEYDERYIGK